MDPHAVNPMAMAPQQPLSMPMGMPQAMSMPMATAAGGGGNPGAGNPGGVQMGMGMNPMAGGVNQYGVPPQQQQQMMMNMGAMGGMNPQQQRAMGMDPNQHMAMKMSQMNPNVGMNPNMPGAGGVQVVGGQVMGADWRIQLTREHRANLIAKMYVVSVAHGLERPRYGVFGLVLTHSLACFVAGAGACHAATMRWCASRATRRQGLSSG